MTIGTLDMVVFDTPDIRGLAAFYTELAGFTETTDADDDWITLTSADGHRLAMQLAEDHVAPRWPDPAYPQQLHLDFTVPDLGAAVERARRLGATRLSQDPAQTGRFVVLADPSGHPFCLCQADKDKDRGDTNHGDTSQATLADVAIDCPDGAALAAFYGPLLGMEVTYSGPEGAMLAGAGKLPVMFQNVADYRAPRWPDPAYPQQLHLDVQVADLDEGEQQVLDLGASRLPGGARTFRVFADPVGHPFCLVS